VNWERRHQGMVMAVDEPIVPVRSSGREMERLLLGNSDDRMPAMIHGRCGVDVRDAEFLLRVELKR
jgi:hypothetical protein